MEVFNDLMCQLNGISRSEEDFLNECYSWTTLKLTPREFPISFMERQNMLKVISKQYWDRVIVDLRQFWPEFLQLFTENFKKMIKVVDIVRSEDYDCNYDDGPIRLKKICKVLKGMDQLEQFKLEDYSHFRHNEKKITMRFYNFPEFKALYMLTIGHPYCATAMIARAENLKYLCLKGSFDEGLIERNKSLKHIEVVVTNKTPISETFLAKKFPAVEELIILTNDFKFEPKLMKFIDCFPNLRRISINGTLYHNIPRLTTMEFLEQLKIYEELK